jgi:two-component system, NtrC family, sensor kinase
MFSVVPLAFVTGYSVVQYERAIDNELTQRLYSNAREITNSLSDAKSAMSSRRAQYERDSNFVSALISGRADVLRGLGEDWLKSEQVSAMTFFDRNGRIMLSLSRETNGNIKSLSPNENQVLILSDDNKLKLKESQDYQFVEYSKPGKFSLILLSKVQQRGGKQIGYLQQNLDLDPVFLSKLKEKMKLELLILRSNGVVSTGTLRDFAFYKKETFEKFTKTLQAQYFELAIRSEPHGFMVYPVTWGKSDFFVGLGASKSQSRAVLSNVNNAFLIVVSAVIGLLIVTIWLTSKALVKPIWDLVNATMNLQSGQGHVEIPRTSDTELGLLTESFNRMSYSVAKTREELKSKITELESANQEIQQAQSQLLHNSKMVSLGQMIAGVAHELNNPIGFIFSNMQHLKEYSEKLIFYGDRVKNDPGQAEKISAELEIDYIKKDMPKLIASCQDGARRTRDIVLGLRNFSRLESAQIKEIDIHEAIDSTLNLLKGELKERVSIVRRFDKIPGVTCNASQINQVFMNLLTNAAQAIEKQGQIWITTRLVKSRNEIEQIEVSIQDSGKGIPPENLEKIFDPFFSTKEIGQGTGLGLSITFSIVQSHGGDIQVKSQAGTGTEFIVRLPVKPASQVGTS